MNFFPMPDLKWKTLSSEYLFNDRWFTVRKHPAVKLLTRIMYMNFQHGLRQYRLLKMEKL